MRTTYYPFIDESTPEGRKTLADSAQDQIDFGVGISSSIGIGTVNNPHAQFAIHFDGSEDNRIGGLEINGNSNSGGDKHGARILAYNRVKANRGFRRLRFSASEYQIETPVDGTSIGSVVPTVNITGFGSVGIGSTDPLAQLDVRGDVRFNNKLYDKDGDSGTSGQVLSSTGTQVDWVNVGTLSAGTASQVAVTASNDDSNFNITFVDSTSGNQSIKADTTGDFVYNPSLGNVGLGTTNPATNIHIVSDKNALIKLVSTDANSGIQFIDPDTGARAPVIYGVGDDFTVWTDWEERFRVKSDGDVHIGTAVTTAGLRNLDVQNLDTADDSGAILRLISSQSDGTGTTSGDIVKYKGGGLVINNNEKIGTAGFISLGTTPDGGSSAVERLRITSTGQVEITGADDQDNLVVNGGSTAFVVHQDDTDGEVSLRAQDGSGNNYTKYMTFFTENGSGPEERLRITEPGNVGIGTDSTIDSFDGGFERRLVVYGGGAQVGSAYTWTGGDFYHAEDIITAVTKTKSGGFAINCREQEVASNDPSRPVWTLRSYSNEPIAFGQGITEIARFNEDGRLGIGTTNPTSQLTLFDRVTSTDGPNTLLTLISDKNDMTSAALSGGQIRFLNQDDNNSGQAFIQANAPDSYSTGNEGSRERTVDFNFIQSNGGLNTLNTRFTIKGETGSVGIGSTIPTEKLDIHAPAAGIGLSIKNSSDFGTSGIHIQGSRNAGTGIVGQIQFHNRRNSIVDSFLKVNGDGNFLFDKNVGIGTNNPSQLIDVFKTTNDAVIKTRTTAAGAYFEADSGDSGYYGIKLSSSGTQKWFFGSYNSNNFQVIDGGPTGSEVFTIEDGTGNVGIGSGDPAHKLAVIGNSKLYGTVIIGNNTDISPSNSGTGQLRIDGLGYTGYIAADGTAMYVGHNASGRNLVFQTDETDRVTIDPDGNVGIGSDSPTQALDVNGKIKVFGSDGSAYGLVISPDSSGGNREHLIAKSNGDLRLQAGSGTYQASAANILLKNTTDHILINAENSGKVGIGTHDPDGALHLLSSESTLGILTSTTNGANLDLYDNDSQSRIRTVNGKLDLRANVGVNTSHSLPEIRFYVDNNLKFNIDNQGQVIFNSMNQSSINSITPTKGGVVFNSTTNKLQVYDGSAWVNLH